jgi:hypothetical protein
MSEETLQERVIPNVTMYMILDELSREWLGHEIHDAGRPIIPRECQDLAEFLKRELQGAISDGSCQTVCEIAELGKCFESPEEFENHLRQVIIKIQKDLRTEGNEEESRRKFEDHLADLMLEPENFISLC